MQMPEDVPMSRVKELEAAIGDLPRAERFALIAWIKEQFADEWDRQIEEDAQAGRLDHLAREARAEYHAGRTRPFPAHEKPCHR
jgi:hypothetical protein